MCANANCQLNTTHTPCHTILITPNSLVAAAAVPFSLIYNIFSPLSSAIQNSRKNPQFTANEDGKRAWIRILPMVSPSSIQLCHSFQFCVIRVCMAAADCPNLSHMPWPYKVRAYSKCRQQICSLPPTSSYSFHLPLIFCVSFVICSQSVHLASSNSCPIPLPPSCQQFSRHFPSNTNLFQFQNPNNVGDA